MLRYLFAVGIALSCHAALGRPPPGTDLNSPEHKYWECFVQPTTKRGCCGEADGHSLDGDHWRHTGANDVIPLPHYQVLVEGTWYDVPPGAVIGGDQNGCGADPDVKHRSEAKVWYAPTNLHSGDAKQGDHVVKIDIYCFIAGTMY